MSSPMYSESWRKGFRFSLGIFAGSLAAAAFIAVLFVPVNAAAQVVSDDVRRGAFVVAAVGFGLLDLAGRTPFVWRQVPQRLYLQGMDVGWLGLLYGADMGLHVTTQKVTSLLWVVFLGSLLLGSVTQIVGVAFVVALTSSVLLFALASNERAQFVDAKLTVGGGISWEKASRLLAAVLSAVLAFVVTTRVV